MAVTRREILMNPGKVASGLAIGEQAMKAMGENQPESKQAEKRNLKVVVTGGHPGDPNTDVAARSPGSDRGDKVVLLYMNNGAWPPTSAPVRVAEAKKACEILGAHPAFVGQVNRHSVVDNSHYEEFRRLLDAEKPDVVFDPWPIDHHPDHRALSTLVLDAWLESHREFALYYYEVGQDTMMFNPAEFVDITGSGVPQARGLLRPCFTNAGLLVSVRGATGRVPRHTKRVQARGSFLRRWESKQIALP